MTSGSSEPGVPAFAQAVRKRGCPVLAGSEVRFRETVMSAWGRDRGNVVADGAATPGPQ